MAEQANNLETVLTPQQIATVRSLGQGVPEADLNELMPEMIKAFAAIEDFRKDLGLSSFFK